MDLFLIRHADAVPFSAFHGTDAERPLTERGRLESRRLADAFVARGLGLNCIIASTLIRAGQTAEEMAPRFGIEPAQIPRCEHLAPGGSKRKLGEYLAQIKQPSVAVIGHMPDIGELAGWLIGSKKVQLHFEKTATALIRVEGDEVEKGCGELLWFLSPVWL